MNRPAWVKRFQQEMAILTPGYTGRGVDGKTQQSKPVGTDLLQLHEGEYVVSAPNVTKNGGPKGVEKKLDIQGQRPLSNMPMQKGGALPMNVRVRKPTKNMDDLDGGPDKPTEIFNVYPYQLGGAINPVKTLNKQLSGLNIPGLNTAPTVPSAGIDNAFGHVPAAPTVPSAGIDNAFGHVPAAPGKEWTQGPGGRQIQTIARPTTNMTHEYGAPNAGGGTPTTPPEAGKEWTQGPGGKWVQTIARPTTNMTHEYGAPPTVPSAGTEEGAAGTEEGAKVDEYSQQVDDATTEYDKIFRGESPIVQAIIDNAFGQLSGQQATQATLLGMQIAANPSMTEGAKRAAIAGLMLQHGVQDAQLANSLAEQALNLSMDALANGTGLSQNQMDFYEDAKRYAKNNTWRTFEYTAQYGSDQDVIDAYYAATGKQLDPASVEEIRNYAREMRRQNIVSGQLGIDSARISLGDQTFESVKRMINGGAPLAEVQETYRKVTQEMFDSIYDAGPLGQRDWDRQMGLATTYLQSGNVDGAAGIFQTLFPGTTIDFSKLVTAQNVSDFNDAAEQMQMFINDNLSENETIDALKDLNLLEYLGGEDAARQLYKSSKSASNPMVQMLDTYTPVFEEKFPDLSSKVVKDAIVQYCSMNPETEMLSIDYTGLNEYLDEQVPVRPVGEGGRVSDTRTYNDDELGILYADDPEFLSKLGDAIVKGASPEGGITSSDDKTWYYNDILRQWTQTAPTTPKQQNYVSLFSGMGADGIWKELIMMDVPKSRWDQAWNRTNTPEALAEEYKDDENYDKILAGFRWTYLKSIEDEGSAKGRDFVGADGTEYVVRLGYAQPFNQHPIHIIERKSDGKEVIRFDKGSTEERTFLEDLIFGGE